MPHFLVLSAPHSARYEPIQPFQTPLSTEQPSTITSPMEMSMYEITAGQKCCEACQCECQTGGCRGIIMRQQQHTFRYDHAFQMLETIAQVSQMSLSDGSDESTTAIDEESLAPQPGAVAPSLAFLSRSPAHRTPEEIRADRWEACREVCWNIDDNPGKHFVSPTEDDDDQQDFEGASMFPMQDVTDSMRATPGESSCSRMSLLSYSHMFQQGGNNSNGDLVGVGSVAETGPYLPLSSFDGR